MKEVLNWLQTQPGGIGTYVALNDRILQALPGDPANAGVARLLAELTGRFVETVDREPLPSAVDRAAMQILKSWLERIVAVQNASAENKLALINELALAEISPE